MSVNDLIRDFNFVSWRQVPQRGSGLKSRDQQSAVTHKSNQQKEGAKVDSLLKVYKLLKRALQLS